jgi:hypothetical protein
MWRIIKSYFTKLFRICKENVTSFVSGKKPVDVCEADKRQMNTLHFCRDFCPVLLFNSLHPPSPPQCITAAIFYLLHFGFGLNSTCIKQLFLEETPEDNFKAKKISVEKLFFGIFFNFIIF